MPISRLAGKVIGDKRRFRAYRARVGRLPAPYRTTIEALERHLFIFGPGTGDSIQAMLDDLIDLFEQGAANATPVREIVGSDPSEFVEQFLRNYPQGGWIAKERERLSQAIDRATAEETGDLGDLA